MEAKLFTRSDMVRYTYVIVQYELAKFRYERESDSRLKAILEQDLDKAYEKVTAIRELLGL